MKAMEAPQKGQSIRGLPVFVNDQVVGTIGCNFATPQESAVVLSGGACGFG